MTRLFHRYFCFQGRLARLPYIMLSIRAVIGPYFLFLFSIPFFSSATETGYRIGIFIVNVCVGLICASQLSMWVRRLHDLGLSGYHSIWIVATQIGTATLSYGPQRVPLVSLPLAVVGFWLLFWPGN